MSLFFVKKPKYGIIIIDQSPFFCDNSALFMKILGYKILLYLLRFLIYSKRAVVWCLQKLWGGVLALNLFFRNIIGFRLYKFGFRLKEKIGAKNLPWLMSFWEISGKRAVLQALLFIIVLAIMYPHSRLYTTDSTKIPGRSTALFYLLGPGEQDFTLEEIGNNFIAIVPQEQVGWKEGAVAVQPGVNTLGTSALFASEITSISIGGGAVNKPNIFPGASLPASGAEGTGRIEIVFHEVQTGESVGLIAEKYQITVATVLWANNLTARSYIRPGDKLKILPVSGVVHKVKKGETIAKIAKLYGSEAGKIIKFNKLKEDGSDIVVGEELLVPNGVQPAPVYVAPVRRYAVLSDISAPPSVSAIGSGYLWPTAVRRITQYFGWRHTGVDVAGPMGTAIYATQSGRVIKSQCGWNGGYGCYIIIDHGNGINTLYGHNSRLYVSVGEEVVQGQTISLMGSTGRSTGPHLHFEVRVNGVRKNPLQYVR